MKTEVEIGPELKKDSKVKHIWEELQILFRAHFSDAQWD